METKKYLSNKIGLTCKVGLVKTKSVKLLATVIGITFSRNPYKSGIHTFKTT